MDAQTIKSTHPILLGAGVAVIIFSAVGIAAVMGWIPISTSSPGPTGEPPKAAQQASAVPPKPASARHQQPPAQVAANAPARVRCAECGVVESVREIEKAGEASGLGAVAGGVVGGVVGNQVGGGRGRDAMTVIGAVGGAVAGNQIEKKAKATKVYEVTIRFEDGSVRTVTEPNAPTWRQGDRVKVINGQIQANA